MAKLVELRQQIKTVENLKSITGTLSTVAAAKLSRTRNKADGLRVYSERMRRILFDQYESLSGQGEQGRGPGGSDVSPLLESRPEGSKRTLFVITSDRGMCGNYNVAVERLALEFRDESERAGKQVSIVAKGQKGVKYFKKRGADICHSEHWDRAGVTTDDIERLLETLVDRYLSGEADEVYCAYTRFYSPTRTRPVIIRMLPISLGSTDATRVSAEGGGVEAPVDKWFYEPSFNEVIRELLAIYLRVQVYDVLLESYASEQGARMITMQEATERADTILQEHQVTYRRLRRDAITIDLLGVLFSAGVSGGTLELSEEASKLAEGGSLNG